MKTTGVQPSNPQCCASHPVKLPQLESYLLRALHFTTEFIILTEFFNTTLEDFDNMEDYVNKVNDLLNSLESEGI